MILKPALLLSSALALFGALEEPPRIEKVVVRASSRTAEVTWTTSVPTDTFLGFAGPGAAGYSTRLAQSATCVHRIELHGLRPGSWYTYSVDARDANGRSTRVAQTFCTLTEDWP